ncbi:MAG: C45 family autoproteolytic acyltransferase/hydrolase [Methanotrichaceae archaeon]
MQIIIIYKEDGGYADGDKADEDRCSAFIATGNATKDDRIVIAHNTWEGYPRGQFYNEILDIKPSKGHRIFMQSIPGHLDSFTDFFTTDAGLVGTETTIGGFTSYEPYKTPTFLRVRKAMQYADNMDQFVKIMETNNSGGVADSWLLGDINTGEIMRFELGLNYSNVTRISNGYFIGFNAPIDPRIRNLECSDTGYADIRDPHGARQVRLTELMEENYGRIDAEVAKAILADHYDVYLKKINPCSRTVDEHYELDAEEYLSGGGSDLPFFPDGTLDGKVANSTMAKNLSFLARWGSSSGMPFNASEFLEKNIQYDYLKGYLKDRLPPSPGHHLQRMLAFHPARKSPRCEGLPPNFFVSGKMRCL